MKLMSTPKISVENIGVVSVDDDKKNRKLAFPQELSEVVDLVFKVKLKSEAKKGVRVC